MCSGNLIVLTFISLITYDVEYLFICLLTICVSSLVMCLLRSVAYFLIRLFVFLLLSFKCSLYILDYSPLLDMSFANIYSKPVLSSHTFDIVFPRCWRMEGTKSAH